MNWLTLFLEFSEFFLLAWVLPWSHPHRRNHELPQLCLDTLHEAWPSFTRCSRDLPSILWCSHFFCLWGGEWLPLSVGKHVFWQRTNQSWRRRRLTMTKPWELTTELKNYWRKLKNAWAKRLRMAWKVSACSFWKMLWQMQKMLWECKSAWRPSMANCGTGEKANTTVRGKWSCKKKFVVSIFDRLCSFLSETCSHFWIERHWVVHVLASSVH